MTQYIIRRMLWNAVVLMVISLITFLLIHAGPGGPFDKEKALPQEIIDNLNRRYHLDEPLYKQYALYVREILVPKVSEIPPGISLEDDALISLKVGEGSWLKWMNFGPSYKSRSRTVNDIFREQLPISIQLGLMALAVSLLIGMPLGISGRQAEHGVGLPGHEHRHFRHLGAGHRSGASPGMDLRRGLQWLPPTGWVPNRPTSCSSSRQPYILFFQHAIMPAVPWAWSARRSSPA
jgi:ABC-type dipeptide/oligopeptide/nickel transport system permease component